jgi:hypothetical protein
MHIRPRTTPVAGLGGRRRGLRRIGRRAGELAGSVAGRRVREIGVRAGWSVGVGPVGSGQARGTGGPADSRDETEWADAAGTSPGMRDQGPERDVWSVFSAGTGDETGLLCWAELDGAAGVRFLKLYP